MKRFWICIAMILMASFPTLLFAVEIDKCDEGTIECSCTPVTDVEITFEGIERVKAGGMVESVDECQTLCLGLQLLKYPSITSWSVQCTIDKDLITIGQDKIDIIEEAKELFYADPQLGVQIPGLEFTPAFKATRDSETVIVTNYLGEYVAGVYNWAIGAGAVLAIVMIMIGGMQYALARGDVPKIGKAKERMANAVTGLLLLVGAYTIAFLIDPATTQFETLTITQVPRLEVPIEPEEDIEAQPPAGLVELQGDNINASNQKIDGVLLPFMQLAALELKEQNIAIGVASSFRSPQKQIELIKQNCQNPPGSSKCNPKPDRPITCMMKNGPTSCPHTTARAFDLWGVQNNKQCIRQAECKADLQACFNNPCQKALIDAMKRQGFCVLSIEPWHFERPKMSSTCK
ncbi:hypothetical protein IH979_03310 [Patescibacteria group bacterium]|nr:hypothetical protein [Patescibacteria group bacterium]